MVQGMKLELYGASKWAKMGHFGTKGGFTNAFEVSGDQLHLYATSQVTEIRGHHLTFEI